jgi:hypothetical protein
MTTPTRLCRLDVSQPAPALVTGHLRLGGTDAAGNRLEVNSQYLTWNGRPFYVISGEFHYSRYPAADWEAELLKIKAGGVNTVATYIFWNYHEECMGEFQWDGQRDVRRFVELCAQHGLKVILRIGPFAHGEWRNGGLPDWLYGQPFEVRSNAPGYLAYVERLYGEIGRQVQGLLFADGGPIIGIQLENEYMHAGAPWEVVDPAHAVEWVPAGHEGVAHLQALKALAHRSGLNTPLYLVTAWGAPIIAHETLPVYGGYAYPVWIDAPEPSDLYTFQDRRDALDGGAYPLIFAEMQGGIQVRYHNRPTVPARSIEALALVSIGKGSNWLGYYMYHGGTTPAGRHGFNHERLHPQLSYDFQAPLGEFGEYKDSYHALRLLHLFLAAFGETLSPMAAVLPANAASIAPNNTDAVRYCARAADGSGFLFVNNFQDHVVTHDLPGVVFKIEGREGVECIPAAGSLTVAAEACFILPFHQALGDALLLSATVQPLTRLDYAGLTHYFCFVPEGLEAEYCFAAHTVRQVTSALAQHTTGGRLIVTPPLGPEQCLELETAAGQRVRITTLSRAEALQVWQGQAWGAERVILSAGGLLFNPPGVELRSGAAECDLSVWPSLEQRVTAQGAQLDQTNSPDQTRLRLTRPTINLPLTSEHISPRKIMVRLPDGLPADLAEAYLRVDYEGDTALAFINGRLVADHFNNGQPWSLGLKRFAAELATDGLCLVFSPWRKGQLKNTSSALAGRVEFEGEERLVIHSITVVPEYHAWLALA